MSRLSADAEVWDVAVAGAGAAGLIAAIRAAERGRRTLLLEKNPRPGVKILMSGGTRCNLTQNTDARGIVKAYGPQQGPFLHSALAAFSPHQLRELVEAEGVPLKVEDTNKVFPQSDKAADVLAAFTGRLARSGCEMAYGEPLLDWEHSPDGFQLVTSKRRLLARRIILTSGGRSYPGSGTTGDGYRLAEKLGHTIIPPRPSLTPITLNDPWRSRVAELKGITLPHVCVSIVEPPAVDATGKSGKSKQLVQRRGSLLFTHFGLSGPVVLDVSRVVSGHEQPRSLVVEIDVWPDQNEQAVGDYLRDAIAAAGKKQAPALLVDVFPRRLAEFLCSVADVPLDLKAAELSKAARQRLVQGIKRLTLPVSGTMGFQKAEVTAGGVCLCEVDSRNMQSKLVTGLFFAGEVLDLDGPIGGYNFQAAFSTGWLAGSNA